MTLTTEQKTIAVVGAIGIGVAVLATFVGKRASRPARAPLRAAERRRRQKKEAIDAESGLPVRFHQQQRFEAMVREQDPDALLVAEDYALQNGLKLTDDGYMVSRAGGESNGSFSLQPLLPPDEPVTRVDWSIHSTRIGFESPPRGWRTEYDIFWQNKKLPIKREDDDRTHEQWPSHYYITPVKPDVFESRKTAEKRAAATAWWAAKQLKKLPPDASDHDVLKALSGEKKIPMTPGLFGRLP
jgi:hypothetical protein